MPNEFQKKSLLQIKRERSFVINILRRTIRHVNIREKSILIKKNTKKIQHEKNEANKLATINIAFIVILLPKK